MTVSTTVENCPGCVVAPGEPHDDWCDHARCPDCGEQLVACLEHDDDPDRPAIWHGVDPRDEVARRLNWWTTAAGVDCPVEDSTRVLFAVALKQITWDRQEQRYLIGQINETALDDVIARSQP